MVDPEGRRPLLFIIRRSWRWLLLALGLLAGLVVPAAAQIAALQGLALQDHRQQAVSAASLAGRPVLLGFVFTGCSSTCPLQVQQLRQLHQGLADATRARVQFVSVTVDPVADTPQALADFARRQQADRPGWRFVGGAPAQVERFIDRMQVLAPPQPSAGTAPRAQPADHRTALYLFAADGRLMQRFRGDPLDLPRLHDEITRLAAAPVAAAPTPLTATTTASVTSAQR